MIRFDWDELRNWEVDDEGLCFVFQYSKPERKPRTVRIHTPYFVYMNDCFNRITEERKGTTIAPANSINTNNSHDTSVVTSTSSTVANDASSTTLNVSAPPSTTISLTTAANNNNNTNHDD